MTTAEKCEEIMKEILARCNKQYEESGSTDWVVAFGPDWGDFSLTVFDSALGHSHVGQITEGGSFEELVTQTHDLLIKGRGLSWE